MCNTSQVCEQLGLLEDDYLGLRYCGNKQEQLWLNLRNRVDQQVSGHQPFRFQLRLKFCVQPHSIQQDITRWEQVLVSQVGKFISSSGYWFPSWMSWSWWWPHEVVPLLFTFSLLRKLKMMTPPVHPVTVYILPAVQVEVDDGCTCRFGSQLPYWAQE